MTEDMPVTEDMPLPVVVRSQPATQNYCDYSAGDPLLFRHAGLAMS